MQHLAIVSDWTGTFSSPDYSAAVQANERLGTMHISTFTIVSAGACELYGASAQ